MTIRRPLLPLLLTLALCAAFLAPHAAYASTNISATASEHYAWNDIAGWINFYSSNTVTVTSTRVQGYANASAGEISLDCATTSGGNICGTSNYYVANNGYGTLSGYAWSDTYGWISFNCSNTGTCGTSSYAVSINPSTGVWSGYAWNDLVGWISFNCSDIGICGTSDYKVKASWTASPPSGTLDSATIDTGSADSQVNSISWTGTEPLGTDVRLQVATANSSSGPWTYLGPDGTGTSYYTPDSGIGIALYPWVHPAGRYFRYRVNLTTTDFVSSATVTDVVVRWSP